MLWKRYVVAQVDPRIVFHWLLDESSISSASNNEQLA